MDRAGLLVRLFVAKEQKIQLDRDNGNGNSGAGTTITPPSPKTHNFFMTAELDSVRINRDVNRILEEVTSHLANSGMKLKFRLEVSGESPDGVDQQTVRTVVENCMALKIRDFHFDE